MASHPQTNLIVSITLERSSAPASSQGCITHLAQLKIGPFAVRGHDVKLTTTDSIPTLEYTIAEAQGVRVDQKNVYACLAQDNVYADIHLSKIQYSAADAPLFSDLLKTVRSIGKGPQTMPTRASGTVTSLN